MPSQACRGWQSILAIVLLFPGLAGADDVRIRGTVVNVRAEGSPQGKVLFQVRAGEVLRLIEVAGDWLHGETPDGRDSQTLCGLQIGGCGRLTLRTCVGGLCTNACAVYYELSDGRRFTCGSLPDCFAGTGRPIEDPAFCLSAAQQAVQACQ